MPGSQNPQSTDLRSVTQIFEAQCALTPDAPAAWCDGQVLTYGQLNVKANRLACLLIEKGIGPDKPVGLCTGRTFNLLTGILAILKAGGCYVPFDPSYPADRIGAMAQDAKLELLLAEPAFERFFSGLSCPVIVPDADASGTGGTMMGNPKVTAGPENLAYILFTSGSTGRPKGVGMVHGAMINLILWQQAATPLVAPARTLQFAPASFDVSFQEIFSTWSTGGCLYLVDDNLRLDAGRLLEFIGQNQIGRLFLPYIALQHLAQSATRNKLFPASLRDVITAGEQLRITPEIREFFTSLPGCRLHNHYGPTETHVVTSYMMPEDRLAWKPVPPIGKPVDHVSIHLFTDGLQPVPEGAPGELYIGGRALASGYVNRDDLTIERFITHPETGERLYRTGDMAELLPDGNYQFLGRGDDQVKVRGYRIEPGEIEVILVKETNVKTCVVAVREDQPGDKRLAAYVVIEEKSPFSPNELRKHLARELPDYMIPSVFIRMDTLPKTASGKIDIKALPPPSYERPDLDTIFTPPASETEKQLVGLWSRLLGVEKIGVLDNFFELGGNSLLALQMIEKAKVELDLDLPVVRLYQHPDIRAIASFLSGPSGARTYYEKARSRPKHRNADTGEKSLEDGIAIVGMAGRFPGASTIGEYWQNLLDGKETTRFFKREELDKAIDPQALNDPSYVAARGIIDAAGFDASFFGINPRLAELMDPQQRVFLEVAWEALEDASCDPTRFAGSVGVFAGIGNNTYYLHNVLPHKDLVERVGAFQVMTLNEKDYIATRVSHELNLTGPALSIHTACSTSLVAVAVAVENLASHNCDLALAGGIAITSPVFAGHVFNEGGMYSADGHTRPFDSKASGTVFSDGCGVVALKRYRDAVRDGDDVYAVIRGVATNNDGSAKASFTAPSVEGQATVVARAQANAGVDPDSITYVETHGTATPLGDPIEVEALTQAFHTGQEGKQFCALGSVKSNFGHLTAAAGVAGLIKTALALRHRKIPPTLNFEQPNPAIDFANTPFYVNDKLIKWNPEGMPRRAGVSSFGVGGTNVHVVLEEAPRQKPAGPSRPHCLYVFSAKSPDSLIKQEAQFYSFVESHPELNLPDAAYTLQTGRKAFAHRRFIVGPATQLPVPGPANAATRQVESGARRLAFMFPGQGAQYPGMGHELYLHETVYRKAVDDCARVLNEMLDTDIRQIMYPDSGGEEKSQALLNKTIYTQPALFVTGYALCRLWESWGVKPDALIGHSIGEYAAACISGVMSLQDALFLVAHRGRMMQELPEGDMLSVRMAAAKMEGRLSGGLSIAAINGPDLCVVSGEKQKIKKLSEELESEEVACKLLVTSHAFHSPMMDPMVAPFVEMVRQVKLNKPAIPILSTVTARFLTDEEATDPGYWSGQVRAAVRFADGIHALWADDPDFIMLEAGPRATASTLARQQARDKRQVAIPTLARTDQGEWPSVLFAMGQLWALGIEINWAGFYLHEKRQCVHLPAYPFDHKPYWVNPPAVQTGAAPSQAPSSSAIAEHVPDTTGTASETLDSMNRKQQLIAALKSMMEEASGIDLQDAGDDMTFLEMGLDSLFLTQSALSVTRKFGVKVTFRQLNEDLGSPGALAGYLDKQLPDSFTLMAAGGPVRPPTSLPQAPAAGEPGAMDLMRQQLQVMQAMLEQMKNQQSVAPSVQEHIDKSVELKSHTADADLRANAQAESSRPFGAIARIAREQQGSLSDKQKKWIEDFIHRYNERTGKSKAYCQQYREVLADPRVVSGFQPLLKELVYQVVVNRSQDARLWDLDGNEYVDVLNGFGSNFFGYNHPLLKQAWIDQIEKGIELGPQTPLAGMCAQLICEMTGLDRAGFCNTGSEAVLGAMRIARTATGKNLIVCFNGSYHGINDEVIVRGGGKLRSYPAAAGIPPESVQNMLVLDYGTDASLKIIRERINEIAAVLIEPVQSRRADFYPKSFIHEVRKLTAMNEVLMIFDEVITGFRLQLGGAQAFYDVKADLCTYGKVIGGNMPVGVIAGRKEYMDTLDGGFWRFGDRSVPESGVTYFAGTFVRHPLAMASMLAVLEYIKKEGQPMFDRLNAQCKRLVDSVNAHTAELRIPFKLVTFGSLFKPKWEAEVPHTELLFSLMRYKGVHIMDGFPCFLTLAFTDADVDLVIDHFKTSLTELSELGFIPRIGETGNKGPDHLEIGNGEMAPQPPVPGARLGKDANGNPGWFIPDPDRPGKFLQVNK